MGDTNNSDAAPIKERPTRWLIATDPKAARSLSVLYRLVFERGGHVLRDAERILQYGERSYFSFHGPEQGPGLDIPRLRHESGLKIVSFDELDSKLFAEASPEAVLVVSHCTSSERHVALNETLVVEDVYRERPPGIDAIPCSQLLLAMAKRVAHDVSLSGKPWDDASSRMRYGSVLAVEAGQKDFWLSRMPRSPVAGKIDMSACAALEACRARGVPALAIVDMVKTDREFNNSAASLIALAIVLGNGLSSSLSGPDNSIQAPPQSPAPIKVELRDGLIAPMRGAGAIEGAEAEFDEWRRIAEGHVLELCGTDFKQGTNHDRIRKRLLALAMSLSLDVEQIRAQEFRLGYEVDLLDVLVGAYNRASDDFPTIGAASLAELNLLVRRLRDGRGHLLRWKEFERAAKDDAHEEGLASASEVALHVDQLAEHTESLPRYFDPDLPRSLRFLSNALRDPGGATRTMVYGAVKSVENVLAFVAERALAITRASLTAVEAHISKALGAALISGLGGVGLSLSGILPHGWSWLKPVLDAISKLPN